MINDNKGFTLLEIILVVAIISILLMIVLLDGTVVLRQKEINELKEFRDDIIYARDKSVLESNLHYIDIDPSKNMYTIFTGDINQSKTIKKKELSEGIVIKWTTISKNEIGFNPSGAPSNAGTIHLENAKGEKISITITPVTGKVTLYLNDNN